MKTRKNQGEQSGTRMFLYALDNYKKKQSGDDILQKPGEHECSSIFSLDIYTRVPLCSL